MFGYAFGSALLLAVSGWSILHLIENVEVQEFDDNLLQYARRLSIIAEQELGVVTFEWEQLDPDSTMQPDPEDSTGHLFRIAGRTLGTVATNIDAFPDARPLPLHWDTELSRVETPRSTSCSHTCTLSSYLWAFRSLC